MQERTINTYISNSSITLMHPLSEEILLSWRLLQIVSFVFNETELSFTICPKCNKCAGRFAQSVSLETGIFIVSSLEERLGAIYPGEKITHDKTISGDVYRIPHSCKRVDKEGIYFHRAGSGPNHNHRSSKLFSFSSFSCIPVHPIRTRTTSPKHVQPQPKYKRCPTPTSFVDAALDSPVLPFIRHSSIPPNCRQEVCHVHARSAITSPSSIRSFRIDKSVSFQPSYSQEDLLTLTKSPSLNSHRQAEAKPKKPEHPDVLNVQRAHSLHWMNSPQAEEWSYNANSFRRDRLGSLDDCLDEPVDRTTVRKSLTPCPDMNRPLYPDNYAKLAIISELDKSFQRVGPLGYDAYTLPFSKRLPDSRSCYVRPSIQPTTFQFPIGPLPVKLMKEPNFSEGGNIIINNTEYQVPRMVHKAAPDPIYDVPQRHTLSSDPSSDTSTSTPPQSSYKPKRYSNKRKNSSNSSNLSSTTLSEGLPYSPDDSDSGPDRITMI